MINFKNDYIHSSGVSEIKLNLVKNKSLNMNTGKNAFNTINYAKNCGMKENYSLPKQHMLFAPRNGQLMFKLGGTSSP